MSTYIRVNTLPAPKKKNQNNFLGLAYPVNGIIMGGLDWTFSTVTMWLANFVCIGLLLAFQPATLNGLWAGACCFGWMDFFCGFV